jgi:nicotinamidase-related amidase
MLTTQGCNQPQLVQYKLTNALIEPTREVDAGEPLCRFLNVIPTIRHQDGAWGRLHDKQWSTLEPAPSFVKLKAHLILYWTPFKLPLATLHAIIVNKKPSSSIMAVNHPSSDSYSKSGFANRMGWGSRPALLIIDVCKAYWSEGSPLSLLDNPEAVVVPDAIRHLLSAARSSGIPVVWSEVEYTHPDMADAGLFWKKSKVLNVWQKGDTRGLADCVEGIVPRAEETRVVKKYASAFFGTSLATDLQVGLAACNCWYNVLTALQVLNIDTLVICGVSTSGCVRATTLDAMQHGFRPMVSESSSHEQL